MPRKNMEFNLEIDDSINEVFDEGVGNSFLAMRRLRWNETGTFKIDLRKWITTVDGKEIPSKGFSFITEEGPENLVNCLLKHGFGNTRKTLEGLQDREDFVPEAMRILSKKGALPEGSSFAIIQDEEDSGSFYDPKEMLGYE